MQIICAVFFSADQKFFRRAVSGQFPECGKPGFLQFFYQFLSPAKPEGVQKLSGAVFCTAMHKGQKLRKILQFCLSAEFIRVSVMRLYANHHLTVDKAADFF